MQKVYILVLIFTFNIIVNHLEAVPIAHTEDQINCNDRSLVYQAEVYAEHVTKNRELVDSMKHFNSLPQQKKEELEKRNLLYNVTSNSNWDLDHNVESLALVEINSTHFISEIFCHYELKVRKYREILYPKAIKEAKLKHKYLFKQQVENKEIWVCVPIKSYIPVLVKTNRCKNGFFIYDFKFESITVSYKLGLFKF